MARFMGSVTQGGADTTGSATIDTGIVVDGKTAIIINAMEVFWDNGESPAAADWEHNVILATTSSATAFSSADEICRVSWGLQNTAGVAVAVTYEPIKSIILLEPRTTAQASLYVFSVSTLTAQANVIRYRVYYETVKMTDVELLRLIVGGA
jgi:hypothetical protein